MKVSRDVPWTFKVVYVLDEKGKVHYFGAVNETEMIVSSTWEFFLSVNLLVNFLSS